MSDQQATDPVCGMTIPRQGALTRRRDGKTYYLCSEMCVSKFDADLGASRLRPDGGSRTPPRGWLKKRPRSGD